MIAKINLDYDETDNEIIISYPLSGSGFLMLRNYLRRLGAKQLHLNTDYSWGVHLSYGYELFTWLNDNDYPLEIENKAKKIFQLSKQMRETPLSREDKANMYSSVVSWLKGGADLLEDNLRKKFPNKEDNFYKQVSVGIADTLVKHLTRDPSVWTKIQNIFLAPDVVGVLFKKGSINKVAHNPLLMGITSKKVKKGEAAMFYHINKAKNISKFYEILAVDNEDGTYDIIRKWGRLSDPNTAKRTDGFTDLAIPYEKVISYIAKKSQELIAKGYIDAFSSNHVHPKTKKALPLGQYPIGLSKAPGYGWGKHTAAEYVRYLKKIVSDLYVIHAEVKTRGRLTSSQYLDKLDKHILHFAQEETTSPVIQHIIRSLLKIRKRTISTDKRLKKDFDNKVLIKELLELIDYLEAQLAYY